MNLFAPAKVNLCLHVTGRADSGYHLIESLVAFADIGDWVDLVPGAGDVEVRGPFAGAAGSTADNLAVRALAMFGGANMFTTRIVKNIPVAAGLGGGSADAGAVARALRKTRANLLPLGADVPVCALSQPCWTRGMGEMLTPIKTFPSIPILLVCPKAPCPTAPVFAAFTGPFAPPIADPPLAFSNIHNLLDFLAHTHNALEAPAKTLIPEVATVLSALRRVGAQIARMSGSGAACFGLFADAKELRYATNRIRKLHPDWWVHAGLLQSFPLFLQGSRERSA
ncbi:MAG TPA: 4-(cytidine 5'-diphospho)-2-C-methyl-D-erythritol kinase [Rhodospirillaceae bacterium]|jgi:4-diphosphocytidyl-2-C-methyl-D-erythritol kinase|nr:4-(cytidine 5'-diphospho)-2-C-methyl-D-erythritol kinase [Alphaproteobacteria bacterium]HBH27159.1 4-(cytidine 5'-diphospho)-2-C-methyl-D-erythritol kinase [Rhodospirillaceae bacterium]